MCGTSNFLCDFLIDQPSSIANFFRDFGGDFLLFRGEWGDELLSLRTRFF
ncbi:Uncharacterised protein [Vibrio cholerae]|uniref:Uncharacterized protein n=1 Tax=Vibrio cholerae TaxID=666 RepID=A0A656A0U3_VIBCL|nr:Uncharacterised protein [Vibrio cholerae]